MYTGFCTIKTYYLAKEAELEGAKVSMLKRSEKLREWKNNRKERLAMRRKGMLVALIVVGLVMGWGNLWAQAGSSWQYCNAFNLVQGYGMSVPSWYTSDFSRVTSYTDATPNVRTSFIISGGREVAVPLDHSQAVLRLDLLNASIDVALKGFTITIRGNRDFDPNEDLAPISRDSAAAFFGVTVDAADTLTGIQIYKEQGQYAGSDVNSFDRIDIMGHPERFSSVTEYYNINPTNPAVVETLAPSVIWVKDSTVGTWNWWHATFYLEDEAHLSDALLRPESYGLPFWRFWIVLRTIGCHECSSDSGGIEGISNADSFYVQIARPEDIKVYNYHLAPDFITKVNMAAYDIPVRWDNPVPSDPEHMRWGRAPLITGSDPTPPYIADLYPYNINESNGARSDISCMTNTTAIYTADSVQPIAFTVEDRGTCVDSVAVRIEYTNSTNPLYFPQRSDLIIFRRQLQFPTDTANSGNGLPWEWKINTSTFGHWSQAGVMPSGICDRDSFFITIGNTSMGNYIAPFIDGAHVRVTIYAYNRTDHHRTTRGRSTAEIEFIVDLSGPNGALVCPGAAGHDGDTYEFRDNPRRDTIEGTFENYRWIADSLPTLQIRLYDDYASVHDITNHGTLYSAGEGGSGINPRDAQITLYINHPDGTVDTLYINGLSGTGVYWDEDDANWTQGNLWINFEELVRIDPRYKLRSGDIVYVVLTRLFDDPDYGQGSQGGGEVDMSLPLDDCATDYFADPNYGTRSRSDNHIPLWHIPCYSSLFSPDTLGIIRVDLAGPTAPDSSFYPPMQWVTSDTFQVITVDYYDQIGVPAWDADPTSTIFWSHVAGVYGAGSDATARLCINIKVRGCDGSWHPYYGGGPDGRTFCIGGAGSDHLQINKINGAWGVRLTFDPHLRNPSSARFRAGDKVCVTVYAWDNAYNECDESSFSVTCGSTTTTVNINNPQRNQARDIMDPDSLIYRERNVARWTFFVDPTPPIVTAENLNYSCNSGITVNLHDISDRVGDRWCDEWVAGIRSAAAQLIFLSASQGGNPSNLVPDTVFFGNIGFYPSLTPGLHAERNQRFFATLLPVPGDPRSAILSIFTDSTSGSCSFFQPGDSVHIRVWAGDNPTVPYYPASSRMGYVWNHNFDPYSSIYWRRSLYHRYNGLREWPINANLDGFEILYRDFENPNWAQVIGPESGSTFAYGFKVSGKTYISEATWFNNDGYADYRYGRPFTFPPDLRGEYKDILAIADTAATNVLSSIGRRDTTLGKFAKDLNFIQVVINACEDSLIWECLDTVTGRTPRVTLALYDSTRRLVWTHDDYYNCHCAPCFLTYAPARQGCNDMGILTIGPLDQLAEWLGTVRRTIVVGTDTTRIYGFLNGDSLVVTVGIHARTPNQFNNPDLATYYVFRWDYKIDMKPPTARFDPLASRFGYPEVNCVARHAGNNSLRVRISDIRDEGVGVSGGGPGGWSAPAIVPGTDMLVYIGETAPSEPLGLTYDLGSRYSFTNENHQILNCADETMVGRVRRLTPGVTIYYGKDSSGRSIEATVSYDTIYVADTMYAVATIQDKLGNRTDIVSNKLVLDNGLPRLKGFAFSTYDSARDAYTDWDPRIIFRPWENPEDSLVGIYNFSPLCTVWVRLWFNDNMDTRDPNPDYGFNVSFRPEGWTSWLPVIPVEHHGIYPLASRYVNYEYVSPRGKSVAVISPRAEERATETALPAVRGWNTDREWIGYFLVYGNGVMDGIATLRIQGFDDGAGNYMLPKEYAFRIQTLFRKPTLVWPDLEENDTEGRDPWRPAPGFDDRLVITGTTAQGNDSSSCEMSTDSRRYSLWARDVNLAYTDSVRWLLWWHDEPWTTIPSDEPVDFRYTIGTLSAIGSSDSSWVELPASVIDIVHRYGVDGTIYNLTNRNMYLTVVFQVFSRFFPSTFQGDTLMNIEIHNENLDPTIHYTTDAGGAFSSSPGLVSFAPGTDRIRIVITGPNIEDVDAILYFLQNMITGEWIPIYPDSAIPPFDQFAPVGRTGPGPYYSVADNAIIYDWRIPGGLRPGLYKIHTKMFDRINNLYFNTSREELENYRITPQNNIYYHTFCMSKDSLFVPFSVMFSRGRNFESSIQNTFGAIYPWPGSASLPDWPAWVQFTEEGVVAEYPYITRFPITTYNNVITDTMLDALDHNFLEQGGYPGDSIYVYFPRPDTLTDYITLILEDEFGGNISGSNLRIQVNLGPSNIRVVGGREYYVYNWIVDDQDNRFDGAVRATVILYQHRLGHPEIVTSTRHTSYIFLDTADPSYTIGLTRVSTGTSARTAVNPALPGERIWVVNPDRYNIDVHWDQTVYTGLRGAETYRVLDPITRTRHWEMLRLAIDGQPHIGRYDDPNDHYDSRLWFNPVPSDPTSPFWRFGDGTYRYEWHVSDAPYAQGLAVILIKGRDAAGNILEYEEARISDAFGKYVLIDVVPPTGDSTRFRATSTGISASAGAVNDNFLSAGYVDPVHNSYIYIVVNGIIRDSSFTTSTHWDYVYDSLGVIIDSVLVVDTTWTYTEHSTVIDTVWANADGSVSERAEVLVPGTTLRLDIYDLAGNRSSIRVPVERHVDRFTYHLCAGWNMVSIPLILDNYTVGAVFPGVGGVYRYDPATTSYVPLTSSDELENGYGYLVYTTRPMDITIEGTALASYTINLVRGWNLIGSVYSPVSFTSPRTDPAGAIEPHTTYWFDCRGYVASDSLMPGRGYLVLVREDAVLRVPGTGKRVSPILKSDAGSTEWLGTMNVSTNGSSWTLKVGEAKNAKPGYDSGIDAVMLPPLPGEISAYLDQFMTTSIKNGSDVMEWSVTLAGTNPFSITLAGLPTGARAELVGVNRTYELEGEVTVNPGVYKLVVYKSVMPKEFALYQNFPNPFNLGTTIRYALPEDANINLSVYNMLGERIVTLVSGEEKAGYKKIFWNGCDASGRPLPSGIYFYKLEAGKFTATQKMLLMK